MSAEEKPVLMLTGLNCTEEEIAGVLKKLRGTDLMKDFNIVGSTKPFLFQTREEFATALQGVIDILKVPKGANTEDDSS